MCDFFSVVSDGNGKIYYSDWAVRQKFISRDLPYMESPDSHTSICTYHHLNDDKVNKYEYNPWLQEFQIGQLNTFDDSIDVKRQCLLLDFKTIVPALKTGQHIITPLYGEAKQPTQRHLQLLKQWASVRDSVWDFVGDFVRDSVWAYLRDSVGASVWDSVRDYAWDSVRAFVRDSVQDSVWDSFRDSVWAYAGSFITNDKPYPCQCVVDLWHDGFVSSFDGKTWRLHSGEKAEIVWIGLF